MVSQWEGVTTPPSPLPQGLCPPSPSSATMDLPARSAMLSVLGGASFEVWEGEGVEGGGGVVGEGLTTSVGMASVPALGVTKGNLKWEGEVVTGWWSED